jgi:glycosyltransferase involved in cell wall biosynthesis
LAASHGIKNELKNFYDLSNLTVIHNPKNIGEIKYKASLKLGDNPIDNSNFNIVSVGMFVEEKEFQYLIEAFAKIEEKFKDNMNLVIIWGDGSELYKLEKLTTNSNLKNSIINESVDL